MQKTVHKDKKQAGFSLIELLIVVGLIGVLTFLGLPYFQDFVKYSSLKNDAWRVLSDLRAYRQLAIVEHMNYRFVFDTNANTYSVEQRNALTDAFIQTVSSVKLSNDLVQATNTTFKPKGEASPGSLIVLQTQSGADAIEITVFATTGLAKMLRT